MMRPALCLSLALLFSVSLHAQTAAQRALASEPEVRQIDAMNRNLQQVQNDPVNRPSRINMAGLSLIDLQIAQGLLDRLEDRLDTEARACSFCSAKQDELSELIRERVALQEMTAHILGSGSDSIQQLSGVTPQTSRWTDIRMGLKDGSSAIRAYCVPLKYADDACKGNDADMRLAGGHENAWAGCLNAHNWVENSSERKAYESCMEQKDPIAALCTRAHKVSSQAAACPHFTVDYSDVDQLHFYHDRFSTDPGQLPASAMIDSNQPAHFTLLEPLIAPAMPTYPGFKTKLRARLDNPLEGEYVPSLNPSTARVSVLDPSASAGLDKRVILIPAGTEFQINATFTGPNVQRGDGGDLDLQIVNLTAPHLLSTQILTRSIPWPQEGTVLLAANSPLSLATECGGCIYSMSVAEYRKRAAEYNSIKASSPANKYGAIVAGTRISIVLLEPVNSTDVQSDKRFHAQLSADSELPTGPRRADAITLPKGTDAYLKISDQNDKPYLGQTATQSAWLRIDYLTINGQKLILKTVGTPLNGVGAFAPVPARGRAPTVNVIESVGARKIFTVAEQTEASIDGVAAPPAQAAPPQTGATSNGQTVQPAPAGGASAQVAPPSGPSGSVNAPVPAAAAPAPTAQQQRAQQAVDNQNRAQKIADCRQQAAKDHPQGGLVLLRAYTVCAQTR